MSSTQEEKKEKILIIDGDGAFAEELSAALGKDGYKTVVVKEGTDGLKSIYDQLPHLVILDVVLPGADAYDILEKKQAEPMLSKIPVFLLSTQGVPINMRRVPKDSVAEYVMDLRIDPADIVEKVNRRFGHEVSADHARDTGSGNKTKLLWVEDDKLIGTILAKKLTASGFDLFHAKNGEEAMAALKQIIPDVIVMDLILPGMSGFEIMQNIKKDPALAKVPILVLSNLSKHSDIEQAEALGAKKFVVKAAASLDQIVQEIRNMAPSR